MVKQDVKADTIVKAADVAFKIQEQPRQTPILSILTEDYAKTFLMTKLLIEMGLFIDPIIYPAVKKNQSRIRMIITAEHSKEELDMLVEGLDRANRVAESQSSKDCLNKHYVRLPFRISKSKNTGAIA